MATESLIGVFQKAASLKVDLFNRSLLLNQLQEGNDRDLARLTSLGLKYAGSWLSVVPSPALGLDLRPAEFVPIVRYRLGINVYSSEGNCPACGQESDKLGDHALACVRSRDKIARHDLLRDVIYEAASSASLAPVKEERHLLPGTAARPGDVFIRRWSDGKDAALDVTVTTDQSSRELQSRRCHCPPRWGLGKSLRQENARHCRRLQATRTRLPPHRPRNTWGYAPPGRQPAQTSRSCSGATHRKRSCQPADAENFSPPNARECRHDHQPPPRCRLLAPRNGWR